jgi:hypothetical protein
MSPWAKVALAIVLVLALLFAIGFVGSGAALLICGLSFCGIESMGIGVMLVIGGVGLFLLFAHVLIRTVNGRK